MPEKISAAERVARGILRWRWPVLALLVLVTAGFALQIPRMVIEISPEGMRLVGHPETLYYEQYIEQYGSDEVILLELWTEDVFSEESLAVLCRLTDEIREYENVDRVVSLCSADDIRGGAGEIRIEPFFEEVPRGEAERQAVRQAVHDNPLYLGNLVSRDDRSTLLVVELDRSGEDFPRKRRELVGKIQALSAGARADGMELNVAGFPVIATVLPSLMVSDQRIFVPLVLLLIVLTLLAAFRSFWGVLLPLVTVIFSVVWTLGFLVLCGKKVEIVTNVLPPLILVIAMADAVHILAHYQEELGKGRGRNKEEAIRAAAAYILVPCLLTSVTTAVGFASLGVSRVAGIRDLGLLASFGVMAAFVVSITLVPVLLSFLPTRPFERPARQVHGMLDRFLARLARFNEAHRKGVLVFTVLLLGLAVAGLFRLKVETTLIKYLKEDNPLAIAVRQIEAHITGTSTLDVVFDFQALDEVKEPENLRKLETMQSVLDAMPLVTRTASLSDLFKRMHQVFNGGDADDYRLPGTREEVAQYLLLYSMSGDEEDLARYVDDRYRTSVVTARVKTVSSAEMNRFIWEVREEVANRFPGMDVRVTGITVLSTNSIDAIVKGQIQSLALALAVICVLMGVLFRSARLGLLSMVPNLIPIVVTLGLMGWAGIEINTATAVISCVAIGIAVDDTIHFLSRYRKEFRSGGDEARAAAATLASTGRALVFTSVVLSLGFMVLVFSSFRPIIYFGLLTGVTMISALVGDLILLPVLLMVTRPMRNTA